MEFSKYIVPVISGNESFGTGFLYKDYLITANHIVTNKINSSFRFDGNWYKLKTNSFIVFPRDEQWRYPNEAQDLFVCKTEIYGSDLILSRSSNKMNNYKYQGYYFDESCNDFMNVVTPELKLYHETAYNEKGEKLYNCFSCKGNVLKSSNSGGPLFEDDVIIVGEHAEQRDGESDRDRRDIRAHELIEALPSDGEPPAVRVVVHRAVPPAVVHLALVPGQLDRHRAAVVEPRGVAHAHLARERVVEGPRRLAVVQAPSLGCILIDIIL